eukprot:543944_1
MKSPMLGCTGRQELQCRLLELNAQSSELDTVVESLLSRRKIMDAGQPSSCRDNDDKYIISDSLASSTQGSNEHLSLDSVLKMVSSSRPDFAEVVVAASAVAGQISDAHTLAEKVSGVVRQLDTLQTSVQRTISLAGAVVELRQCVEGAKACLAKGDLVGAVQWVEVFRGIDVGTLVGLPEMKQMKGVEESLATTVINAFTLATMSGAEDEAAIHQLLPMIGTMNLAGQALEVYLTFVRSEAVVEIAKALEESPSASSAAVHLSNIFNAAARLVQRQLPMVVKGLSDVHGGLAFVHEVYRCTTTDAVTVIQKHIAGDLLQELIREIKQQQSETLSNKIKQQKGGTSDWSSSTGVGIDTSLKQFLAACDVELDELALLLQHSESFMRFIYEAAEESEEYTRKREEIERENHGIVHVSTPNSTSLEEQQTPSAKRVPVFERTSLDELTAEVSTLYTQLELFVLQAGINKAIEIDEILDGLNISTCPEDAFFVARRCAHRGLVTGHSGTSSAVINHICNVLLKDLLRYINTRISTTVNTLPIGSMKLDAVVKQFGQLDFSDLSSLKDQMQGMRKNDASPPVGEVAPSSTNGRYSCLVYINDLESCRGFAERLREELLHSVPEMFQPGHGTDLLLSCLVEMNGVEDAFLSSRTLSLEEVLAKWRPVLKGMVTSSLGVADRPGVVSYTLNTIQYTINEARDPWAHEFVSGLESFFVPYAPPNGLLEPIFKVLLGLSASYIAERLESSLLKRQFTQLGGFQLDRDLRVIMGFFAEVGGVELRGKFARLQQIATLLSLDTPGEASDCWNSRAGALKKHMSAREVKMVLGLRS